MFCHYHGYYDYVFTAIAINFYTVSCVLVYNFERNNAHYYFADIVVQCHIEQYFCSDV